MKLPVMVYAFMTKQPGAAMQSYACLHCYHAAPELVMWITKKEDTEFKQEVRRLHSGTCSGTLLLLCRRRRRRQQQRLHFTGSRLWKNMGWKV